MAAIKRSWNAALADRVAGWMYSLPPELCTYTVQRVRIPVEQGVELAADLYQPSTTNVRGTILVRSPYGIEFPLSLTCGRIFAARGYQVLLNSCRGTGASGGQFQPGAHEAADGEMVILWMRKQPWYSGSFATLGGSYLSFTQWAILSRAPEDMKTAVLAAGPHDWASYMWDTGALNSDFIFWAGMMSLAKRRSWIPLPLRFWLEKSNFVQALNITPLLGGINEFIAGGSPTWLRECMDSPDVNDLKWTNMRQIAALECVNIPITLFTGWQDFLLPQVMQQYSRLSERGCPVALTVGPWTHLGAQRGSTKLDTLKWLDEYLALQKPTENQVRVRIFVTGLQQWRNYSTWPPATQPCELYFGSVGNLSRRPPSTGDLDSVFSFDPTDPTPTIGAARLSNMDAGTEDDGVLASRTDVLSFTTIPLERELEISGKPSIVLYHSSSLPHVDVFVRLSEVDARNRSRSITEHYVRLERNDDKEPLELRLVDCAHLFRVGSRIRVMVAGGSHPRYIRNTGLEDNSISATRLCSVTHTIRHNAAAPSRIILPMIAPLD